MPSKRLIAFFVSALVIFIGIVVFLSTKTYHSRVTVGNKDFSVEVVDTNYLLEKGLSGHAPLLDGEGMLFVFKNEGKYGFWMKDMLFPIDIIWIDENFKIVHIEKNIGPETYPKTFYPDSFARYVLEIKAGESQMLQIKIGDSVKITKKWL